jgi:hypothetical protein
MLKNRHNADGSGLSSYCRLCGKDPAVKHLHEKERKLAWYYRQPEHRFEHEDNLKYFDAYGEGAARKRRDAEVRARIAEIKAQLYAAEQAGCVRCREIKPLTAFPRVKYGRLDHSEVCSDCWVLDPDAKAGLNRERVRMYGRAMRADTPRAAGQRSDAGAVREGMRERFAAKREHDDLLRDYERYGYARADWEALGEEGRKQVRLAAFMAEEGA